MSRDRIFAALKKVDPAGVERRRVMGQRKHRGEYIVEGPNAVWSVDGYEKLANWGIQIYAAIDAYSRYIIWFYVGERISIISTHVDNGLIKKLILVKGIANRCAVSCFRQYLDVVRHIKVIPQLIRSDRGVETSMMADAHYKLRSTAFDRDKNHTESTEELSITDVWAYGTSTLNVRIESWWGQLAGSETNRWRVSSACILSLYIAT